MMQVNHMIVDKSRKDAEKRKTSHFPEIANKSNKHCAPYLSPELQKSIRKTLSNKGVSPGGIPVWPGLTL